MSKIIAITGMGLCGNAAFCRLIRLLEGLNNRDNNITILIFEQKPQYLATGFAYSIDSPEFWTLNNPAEGFKFISGADSLTDWMKANSDFIQSQFPHMDKQYIPRALVGHYLRSQYEQHKVLATSLGFTVKELFMPVLEICVQQEGTYQIKCTDQTYLVNGIFLTTGHLANHFFHTVENQPGFLRLETLIENPDTRAMTDDIYIIGGQAAFVDSLLWLTRQKNYSGTIHCVTRSSSTVTTKGNTDNCKTTAQQQLSNDLQKRSPNTLTFTEAKLLFWGAYYKDANNPVDPDHPPSTSDALHYQMNKFDNLPEQKPTPGNIDELRAFIKTFYFSGCYTGMWNSLNDEGKEQFLNYFYSLLMAYLTGITPLNARVLLHLYEQNKIVEHHGLVSVSYDEPNHRFQLSFASGDILFASTLIDATGYRYKPVANIVDPMLLDKLADTGLISARTYGGVHLTDHFQVIDTHGKVHENLFCLGPIANYNNPVPTPHSSFMIHRDVEVLLGQFVSTLLDTKWLNQPKSAFSQ